MGDKKELRIPVRQMVEFLFRSGDIAAEYRNRGLAAAALSEMYRKTKKLGATHMTGGDNEFYKKIGYKSAVKWTYWKKE